MSCCSCHSESHSTGRNVDTEYIYTKPDPKESDLIYIDESNDINITVKNCSIPNTVVEALLDYSIDMIKFATEKFSHFAVIYSDQKKSFKIHSFGFNQTRKGKSIHAEVDAINNLIPLPRSKRLKKVSILVIRLSKGMRKLSDSKCCLKCCEAIYKIPPLRGYNIENVAFSTRDSNIIDTHPIDLLVDDTIEPSIYFRNSGYKPKIRTKILSNPTPIFKFFIEKKQKKKRLKAQAAKPSWR